MNTKPSKYEIVHYQPKFKRQIIELQTHLWSPDLELNTAYFDWKYEQNPYHREKLIYLALHNGKAVGMRGMFGLRWQVGLPPQTLEGLYADDLVIAPEHRNKGLPNRIMKTAFNDLKTKRYQYLFNLSASPITFLGSLGMGWKSVGSVQPVIKQTLSIKLYRRFKNMIERFTVLGGFFGKAFSFAESRPFVLLDSGHRLSRFVSVDTSPKPEAMAKLVERLDHGGRVRHVRDQIYFGWRFRNPLHRYRFLFWKDDRLEGYLVLQKRISAFADSLILRIVDWEASSHSVFADLLQAAVRVGKFSQVLVWTATLPAETRSLLERAGFKTYEQGALGQARPSILVRTVQNEMPNNGFVIGGRRLLDMDDWDLRMIYSMHG